MAQKNTKELKTVVGLSLLFLAMVLGMNLYSMFEVKRAHTVVEDIYHYPLQVFNATLDVQKNLFSLHEYTEKLSQPADSAALLENIAKKEQEIEKSMQLIKQRLLKKECKEHYQKALDNYLEYKEYKRELLHTQRFQIENKTLHALTQLEELIMKVSEYTLMQAHSMKKDAHHIFIDYQSLNRIFLVLIVVVFFLFFLYIKKKIERFTKIVSAHEEELKSLYERLDIAVEGTNDGLWDWNLRTNEVYFSPRWKEMLGYKDDELSNSFETWQSRVHPDDLPKIEEDIQKALHDPSFKFQNIHRLRHKDGHWVWILDRGKTLFDADNRAVRMVGFHTDITEQKELERALKEKEEIMIMQSRHAAMGEMISMIAHQWRQPISVIAMDANNILADIELEIIENESLREVAGDIIQQTQELSRTIDDFKDYFKPNKNIEEVDIQKVIDDTLSVIGKMLENHEIKVRIEGTKNLKIKTYERELMHVFINIIKNAKDALVEKEEGYKEISIVYAQHGDDLKIEFCDTGVGIQSSVIDKIFDPYFTTKNKKNGTGLGLYMSKTTLEKHLGGTIKAYNKKEGGACFVVTVVMDLTDKEREK